MRLWLTLLVAALCSADPTSDGLQTVFSSVEGLRNCILPCAGDLIRTTKELLSFNDTVNKFIDFCHAYESTKLCVSAKDELCVLAFTFATSGIEELCVSDKEELQAQFACLQKNADGVLNTCNSQCSFTSALQDIANKDPFKSNTSASIGKEFEELCPATSCFVSCMSGGIDNSCPAVGSEIASGSDSESTISSFLPDGCRPFLDVDALNSMAEGTFIADNTSGDAEPELLSDVAEDESTTSTTTSSPTELEQIADAAGVPECADSCFSDLFSAADHVFAFNGTIQNVQRVCIEYERATECMASRPDCTSPAVVDIILSSIDDICVNKMSMLADHEDCLAEHLDEAFGGCDEMCGIVATAHEVTSLSAMKMAVEDRKNIRAFLSQVGPLCTSIGCLVSCAARSLDQNCAPVGQEIAKSLLRPFTILTQALGNEHEVVSSAFKEMLPSKCLFLVNEKDLTAVAEGVQDDKWDPLMQSRSGSVQPATNFDREPWSRADRVPRSLDRTRSSEVQYGDNYDQGYERKHYHRRPLTTTATPYTTTPGTTSASSTATSGATTTIATSATTAPTTTVPTTTLVSSTTDATLPARDPATVTGQAIVCVIHKNGNSQPVSASNIRVHCQPLPTAGQADIPLPIFPVTRATTASTVDGIEQDEPSASNIKDSSIGRDGTLESSIDSDESTSTTSSSNSDESTSMTSPDSDESTSSWTTRLPSHRVFRPFFPRRRFFRGRFGDHFGFPFRRSPFH